MHSRFELSLLFFLQLAAILGVCRGVGWLARRMGQPQVVGEMIAGVMLGPSLLGWAFPGWQQRLFPAQSMTILFAVSQVGLSLYMFLVGLEFREDLLRQRLGSAAWVSAAGMVVPFVLGAAIAAWLVGKSGYFGPQAHRWDACLFLGAAMSITAFPMLARIVYERGLAGTALGTLVLAAGAVDDAAAWCVLAVVLASFDHSWGIAVRAIGGGVGYVLFAFLVLRRWLKPLETWVEREGRLTQPLLGLVLMLVMAASWFTDAIGIYAVFGAFVLGVAMPRGRFATEVQRQLEPVTVALLLPLFFTYSGLNTRLDLLLSWSKLPVLALLLLAACLGKGVACYAAARWRGEDHRVGLAVGTLMNARGLMELIILNIGLDRGIVTAELFSMMVAMAIVTTLMASPLFERFYGRRARASGQLGRAPTL
jgi:Kef-type K+ transport system membrane component KefB